MNCEKTGAQLYIAEYNAWVVGDVYRAGDTTVIARIAPGISYGNPLRDEAHYRVERIAQWWDRDRSDVYSMLVAESPYVREYGYHGVSTQVAEAGR